MTHVIFDPDNVDWSHFVEQPQEGRGKYFVGTRYQRGYGLISNIGRFLLPIAKNIANTASAEGISVGTKVLSDLAEGKNLKTSLIEHGKQGVENVASKLKQCGKGVRRKRKRKPDQLTLL